MIEKTSWLWRRINRKNNKWSEKQILSKFSYSHWSNHVNQNQSIKNLSNQVRNWWGKPKDLLANRDLELFCWLSDLTRPESSERDWSCSFDWNWLWYFDQNKLYSSDWNWLWFSDWNKLCLSQLYFSMEQCNLGQPVDTMQTHRDVAILFFLP